MARLHVADEWWLSELTVRRQLDKLAAFAHSCAITFLHGGLMNPIRSSIAFLAVATAFGVLTGCGDDFGEPCDFPPIPQCEQESETGIAASCLFTQSADCQSRMCAIAEGSAPYCTDLCETADDCALASYTCFLPPGGGDAFCAPANN